jgi:hypothetical protein
MKANMYLLHSPVNYTLYTNNAPLIIKPGRFSTTTSFSSANSHSINLTALFITNPVTNSSRYSDGLRAGRRGFDSLQGQEILSSS